MNITLKGIFPALTSPFSGETVCPEKLKGNILKYDQYDLSGYVLLGSTGEAVYLSDEEAEILVKAAKKWIPADKILIVGTARESTYLTLRFTERMTVHGIDAALIRTPIYYKTNLTQKALRDHYVTIAEKTAVPVILYNTPQQTGISLDPELATELSYHPNITGIKDSSGDQTYLEKLVSLSSPEFSVLTGAGNSLLSGLRLGAAGAILAMADVVPGLCLELFTAFQQKDWKTAENIQKNLIPLNTAITQTYGVAGAKYALDLLGLYGGPCRFPLQPLSEENKKNVQDIIRTLQLKPF